MELNDWVILITALGGIEGIKSAFSNVKFIFVLPPLEAQFINQRDNAAKNKAILQVRKMINNLSKTYGYVSEAMYCLDQKNGYDLTNQQIADVYEGITEVVCTDTTHSKESGCKEWGQNVFPILNKVLLQ